MFYFKDEIGGKDYLKINFNNVYIINSNNCFENMFYFASCETDEPRDI